MREIFAALQRFLAQLDGFNKVSFLREVAADCLLRKRIRVATSWGSQFRELVLLLRREMYFHERSVRAQRWPVNGGQFCARRKSLYRRWKAVKVCADGLAGAGGISGLAYFYVFCKGGDGEVGTAFLLQVRVSGKEGTLPINKRASRDQGRDAGGMSSHLCQQRKGGPATWGTSQQWLAGLPSAVIAGAIG